MEIVLNRTKGSYALSKEAYKFLGIPWDRKGKAFEDDRTNFFLVQCVKTLGERASIETSRLMVVWMPDKLKDWHIKSYEGMEEVQTDCESFF